MQTKPYAKTIEVNLLEGPTITVRFSVDPPDPENGFFQPYVTGWEIVDDCGLDATIIEKENKRILDLCYAAIS